MSLHLHRAERSDRLVGGLADLLAEPLPDPFATEIVAVPTRGVERWLAQQVSDRLGVCAGVDFPSVRRLVADALEPVTAVDSQSDPWQPSRAVWPILAIVDAARDETWAELLWSHLRGGSEERPRGGRRWLTARRAADLFARYASERPELLARWRAGEDVDSAGRALRIDRAWQAELLRRLRAERRARPGRADWPPHCPDLADRRRSTSTCPSGCRCSARPGSIRTSPACWSRSPRSVTSTCGCRIPPRLCGTRLADHLERSAGCRSRAGPTTAPRTGPAPAARPIWAATPASCSSWLPRRGAVRSAPARCRTRPARHTCSARLQPDIAADTESAAERGATAARARRPQRAGPRLPRPGSPGRGAAGGAGRPARRRRDPGTPRHRGDVPRHRDGSPR